MLIDIDLSASILGTIKLPGVVEIVPDAVEAADDGGFRGHECIAEPDGEDRVLLAERLSCRARMPKRNWMPVGL